MGRGSVGHRVFIEDARRNGSYLRATWHADGRQFVLSTWRDDVCTGAVRVPASDAPRLIGLLADGLADAADRMVEVPPLPEPGRLGRLLMWLRRRWHRRWSPSPAPAVSEHDWHETRRSA